MQRVFFAMQSCTASYRSTTYRMYCAVLEHAAVRETVCRIYLPLDVLLFVVCCSLLFGCIVAQGYIVSPFLAYNFSELIESHAVDTYTEFAEANKDLLQSLPPPPQVSKLID